METLTLQKGVLEAPQVNEVSPLQPTSPASTETKRAEHTATIVDTARTAGAIALAGEGVQPATPERHRYGYREDSPPEIVALLEQAQAGNTEAYGDLYRLHRDRVTRYVAARMKDEDRQAVPDVVQDAFCEAFADLPNAHHDVTGWLLVHAAKAYIRYARSARHQERAIKESREMVRREYAHGYARQHRGVTAIGHVTLVHALARLAPRQREVVQHRYLEGQTQKATAVLLGKTLSAVRSAEHRALVRLRDELSGNRLSNAESYHEPRSLVPTAA